MKSAPRQTVCEFPALSGSRRRLRRLFRTATIGLRIVARQIDRIKPRAILAFLARTSEWRPASHNRVLNCHILAAQTFLMSSPKTMLARFHRRVHLSRLGSKVGSAFWAGFAARANGFAANAPVFQERVAALPGARCWPFSSEERVQPVALPQNVRVSLGHELAARPYRLRQPFVAEVERVWLVGTHATPFTTSGKMLLSPFRDSLGFLSLESHPDLL